MQECMGMFDWDDARYFLAVHRQGSLSAAGRQLKVEQSTVGRRISALEEALGVRLFDRTPDGFVLTPAGEGLLPRFERIEEEVFAVEREAGGREARLSGTVRLTAPENLGSFFVAPLLARFRTQYPEIALELVADNRTLSLSKREADVALRLSRPTQPLLVTRKLAEVGTALYASEGYLASHGRPRQAEFSGHDFIGFDETYQPIDETRWLTQHSKGARFVFKSNSVRTMLSAALAGMGLVLLPCYVAEGFASLVRLLPPSKVVRRELWLVLHKDLRHSARIRALSEFLLQETRKHSAVLAGSAKPSPRLDAER